MSIVPVDITLTDPTVMVVPWNDPVVDGIGYDIRSTYVELFWLNVLGPSATWLVRRLAIGFDRHPMGYEADLQETASSLGLAFNSSAASPFARSLNRCVLFGVVHPIQGGLAVRRRLPPVARRHLMRMPETLRDAHLEWQRKASSVTACEMGRAARLTEAMLNSGDSPDDVERQLLALGVTPAAAVDAAAQAMPQLRR